MGRQRASSGVTPPYRDAAGIRRHASDGAPIRRRAMDERIRTATRLWTLAQPAVSAFITGLVRDCVSGLPPRQRDLIRMFYGENRSAGEIAASWNRTVHAVYKALATLRRALLECVTTRLAGMADDDDAAASPASP